jgi:Sortase domain
MPELTALPVGLIAAVLAALLLWPIGARLGLSPASRAAAAAIYATAAVLVQLYAPVGTDGRATMLLVAAAGLAVGSRLRNALAAVLTVVAVVLAPVTAVGFLILLGAMAVFGSLATRFRVRIRWVLALAGWAAAAALAARLVRVDLPPALPPVVLGVLSVWTLLVVTLLWRRMRWLRPLGVALLALLACCWLPGPDTDAVLVLAAVGGVLTALLAEEHPGLVVRRAVAVGIAALALLAALVVPGDARRTPAAAGPAPAGPNPGAPPAMPAPQVETVAAVRPVAIAIPSLGVAGPLEDLAADPVTGELAAPDDPSRAGWYAAGVVPGDAGPAVVGGHVDSRAGPGVFFGLRGLRPGDEIEITRSDGRAVRFAVTAVAAFPKAEFPTAAVYGPAPGPELRLVTCGGQFDRTERSYRDNIVVDAVLV